MRWPVERGATAVRIARRQAISNLTQIQRVERQTEQDARSEKHGSQIWVTTARRFYWREVKRRRLCHNAKRTVSAQFLSTKICASQISDPVQLQSKDLW